MFSLTHNFIFIHCEKTGGGSLQNILLKYSDDKMKADSLVHDGKNRFDLVAKQWTTQKHQTLQKYYDLMPKEIWENQKIVTSLRHPVDRLLSYYFGPDTNLKKKTEDNFIKGIAAELLNQLNTKINILKWKHVGLKLEYHEPKFNVDLFKQFIQKRKSQSNYLSLNEQIRQPDIAIDFANFEQSARAAFKKLNIPETEVPYRNKAMTKQQKHLLAKRKDVIDAVMNSHHAEDFENFSYMGWKV